LVDPEMTVASDAGRKRLTPVRLSSCDPSPAIPRKCVQSGAAAGPYGWQGMCSVTDLGLGVFRRVGYPRHDSMHLRKHLRAWATAWLAFQLVTFSAFVPRDCCITHNRHQAPVQQAAADDSSCTMQHGDHHAAAQPAPAQPSERECAIRGRCDGPMAVLLSVLSTFGVLADSPVLSPVLDQEGLASIARENLVSRVVPPDSPPPRS